MKLTTEELFIRHAKADKPSLLSKSIICLHNIRSAYNVGAVFRNADAFGIQQVFLSGFTPTPENNIDVSKTAIGAEKQVPWNYFALWSACQEKLQKTETKIFAVEQTKKSVPLTEYDFNKNTISNMAFVFGNEVKGLDDEVLESADHHLIIPQFGTKHSLNISVATGVVMYDLLRKSM
tara:strand:+ start:19 stop:552 length:534 start_codon:yes stop_codon:yes gene_type:complete